jgi:hypothetical protein
MVTKSRTSFIVSCQTNPATNLDYSKDEMM